MQSVLREGFIRRLAPGRRSPSLFSGWQRVYAVLDTRGRLAFFKQADKAKPVGTMSVKRARITEGFEELNFTVEPAETTEAKVQTMKADTPEEHEKWVADLKRASSSADDKNPSPPRAKDSSSSTSVSPSASPTKSSASAAAAQASSAATAASSSSSSSSHHSAGASAAAVMASHSSSSSSPAAAASKSASRGVQVPKANPNVHDPWTAETAAAYRASAPLHDKARKLHTANVARFPVPDDKVPFAVPFPEYEPVNFVAKVVADQPFWADIPANVATFKYNDYDSVCKINRKSHEGVYQVNPETHLPINPRGRTGMIERGLLGRYGPNHAADPVVTRWMRDEHGRILMDPVTGHPRIEFVAIMRQDNNEWAIPGGMVDPGEDISVTLKREFSEEAANNHGVSPEEYQSMKAAITNLFKSGGVRIYSGYVDDPRNTDNSWMETVVVLFHDNDNSTVSRFVLKSGTDAKAVQWAEITPDIKLYASHREFVLKAKDYLLKKYIFA